MNIFTLPPRSAARLFLFLACMGFAELSHAAVIFTAVGEITQVPGGGGAFILGETITVSFTARTDIGTPNQVNDANEVIWNGYYAGAVPLWSDITISGATGVYAPDTKDDLNSQDSPSNYIFIDAADNASIGLSRGGEAIDYIDISFNPIGRFATFPGDASTRPETVYVNGTYTTSGRPVGNLETGSGAYEIEYTTLTISGAQIPEPGTLMLCALAGLTVLGQRLVFRQRRT